MYKKLETLMGSFAAFIYAHPQKNYFYCATYYTVTTVPFTTNKNGYINRRIHA